MTQIKTTTKCPTCTDKGFTHYYYWYTYEKNGMKYRDLQCPWCTDILNTEKVT